MYQRIGTFSGLSTGLAGRYNLIGLDHSPQGYGSTSDRYEKVREVYIEFHDLFPREWPYSMVTVIEPNGTIPPHHDAPLTGNLKRYHIVLQSINSWSFHDGVWSQLEEGGIYTMDCCKIHAAVNWGDKPRVHLVIDTEEFCEQ